MRRLPERAAAMAAALALAIALTGVPGRTLAADTGALTGQGPADLAGLRNDAGQLSTAVYLSDGGKFPGWTQWSVRDGGWIDAAKWAAGDFSGDGKADIAAIWNNGGTNTLTVSQSTGSAFTRSHWATNAGGWGENTAWLPGDFNGDGKTDLAAAWNDGGQLSTAVYLSDGAKFPGWTQWSVRDGGWIDAAKWAAGDFNGDGKTDIVAIWNNGGSNTLTVSQSTGSGFTRSHWATDAGGWSDSAGWLAGDFNGDGRIDLAGVWNDAGQLSTAVYLSDGGKFPGWTQWSVRDGGWIDAAKWAAGDFSGDGKADIAAIWNNGGTNTLTVSQSTGSAFTRSHWATNAGGWGESTAWRAGDFNGDGKADIAAAWDDADPVAEHLRPGQHTRELGLGRSLRRWDIKGIGCDVLPLAEGGGRDQPGDQVGWWQHETSGGTACGAAVSQVAVLFDTGFLDQVPDKTINRAVLTYDEVASLCNQIEGKPETCWTSGSGQPEHKPDGCVVVGVPTVDWRTSPPPGLLPFTTTRPDVKRLATREWDVTQPLSWQLDPRAMGIAPPGAPAATPGFGLLLTGGPSLQSLEAQDNTSCMSQVTNIRLHVTYTVPPGGDDEPFRDPR